MAGTCIMACMGTGTRRICTFPCPSKRGRVRTIPTETNLFAIPNLESNNHK